MNTKKQTARKQFAQEPKLPAGRVKFLCSGKDENFDGAAEYARTHPDFPDWVTSTPVECSYVIEMYDSAGDNIETLALTRDEYIGLKRELAALRSYKARHVTLWPRSRTATAA
jgi:hypothetical protein